MKRFIIAISLIAATTSAAIAEAIPKWTVACESATIDQFGDRKR